MWQDPDLRRYSFTVHFLMASMVGFTMIAVGLFINWRVAVAVKQSAETNAMLREVREHHAIQEKILRHIEARLGTGMNP